MNDSCFFIRKFGIVVNGGRDSTMTRKVLGSNPVKDEKAKLTIFYRSHKSLNFNILTKIAH